VAANGTVPPVTEDADVGEMLTAVTDGLGGMGDGGAGVAVTVTPADADFVGSALLVAVTIAVPALPGAVKTPEAVILPDDAFQATDLSVAVPWTAAEN
jgi:hypothetical protein